MPNANQDQDFNSPAGAAPFDSEPRAPLQLPWKAVETQSGWELQCESGGWLFELNDRPNRATEIDQVFIESQDAIMRFIVRAGNAHHDLLSFAKRVSEACSFPENDFQRVMRDEARKVISKAEG